MKIVFISDTHGKHKQLLLPKGDMLIHAGDISSRGHKGEIEHFLQWFAQLDYKHKIFIAGNHDFYFEEASAEEIKEILPENVIYLNDSGVIINGQKIWGSPVQPWFYNWAFNRKRGAEIKKHWDLIPSDTDILITHGPPVNILDETSRGEAVGCQGLLNKILEINPHIHVFGHIHEAYGQIKKGRTHFINASVLNLQYQLVNTPIVFELEA